MPVVGGDGEWVGDGEEEEVQEGHPGLQQVHKTVSILCFALWLSLGLGHHGNEQK